MDHGKTGVLGAIAAALATSTLLTSPSEGARSTKRSGNPSGHFPHQGKKEMARRLKKMKKETE